MNKKQVTYGIAGLIFTAAGFVVKIFFRDYIEINRIYDFSLWAMLPSFLFVIGFSQLLLIKPPLKPRITIWMVVLASVLFELRQYYSTGIADYVNLIASLAGGFISLLIWQMVERRIV